MRAFAWAGLTAAIALSPAVVQAQTCIGVPISAGQFGIGAEVGFLDGGKRYSGIGTANLNGPLSLQVRVDVLKADDVPDDVDDSTTAFGGQAAYKLVEASSYSACPFVGVSYLSEGEGDNELSLLTIPIGVGIGVALPTGGLDLSAFATPQLLINRVAFTILGESFDDTSTDFGTEIGARIRAGALFFGGSVFVTSVEDSDPEFRLGVGVGVGGNR
jgi:hypothetical protein